MRRALAFQIFEQGLAAVANPEDFLKELAKNKKAKAFFETLNRAVR